MRPTFNADLGRGRLLERREDLRFDFAAREREQKAALRAHEERVDQVRSGESRGACTLLRYARVRTRESLIAQY